jgi:hypothetical protein
MWPSLLFQCVGAKSRDARNVNKVIKTRFAPRSLFIALGSLHPVGFVMKRALCQIY